MADVAPLGVQPIPVPGVKQKLKSSIDFMTTPIKGYGSPSQSEPKHNSDHPVRL